MKEENVSTTGMQAFDGRSSECGSVSQRRQIIDEGQPPRRVHHVGAAAHEQPLPAGSNEQSRRRF